MKKIYLLLSFVLLSLLAINVQAQLDTVFYYNFDDAITDASSNGNDLTAAGSSAALVYGEEGAVEGKGKYLDLSANTDSLANVFVSTPANIFNFGAEAYTLTGWAKINETAGRMQIANQLGSTGLSQLLMKWKGAAASTPWFSANLAPYIEDSGDSTTNSWAYIISPADSATSLEWFHFGIIIDPDNSALNFYWNGQLQSSTNPTYPPTSTDAINFGAKPESTEPLDGALDELYLFKGVLTQEQIAAVMDSDETKNPNSAREMKLDGVRVYPNPVQNRLTIDLGTNSFAEVKLISYTGAVVLKTVVERNKETIDISHISQGIYLMNVAAANKTYTMKVVKN